MCRGNCLAPTVQHKPQRSAELPHRDTTTQATTAALHAGGAPTRTRSAHHAQHKTHHGASTCDAKAARAQLPRALRRKPTPAEVREACRPHTAGSRHTRMPQGQHSAATTQAHQTPHTAQKYAVNSPVGEGANNKLHSNTSTHSGPSNSSHHLHANLWNFLIRNSLRHIISSLRKTKSPRHKVFSVIIKSMLQCIFDYSLRSAALRGPSEIGGFHGGHGSCHLALVATMWTLTLTIRSTGQSSSQSPLPQRLLRQKERC